MNSSPVHIELNWNFNWPVCDFSVFDWFAWVDPSTTNQGPFSAYSLKRRFASVADSSCSMGSYGYGYGNSLPWISWDLFPHMDATHEIIPFNCYGNIVLVPAPFCNVESDPDCQNGCNPAVDANCLPNPFINAPNTKPAPAPGKWEDIIYKKQ